MKRVVIFFCQNLSYNKEEIFKVLDFPSEISIRLMPIPCSAEISVGFLLKILETDIDAIFILTCPVTSCQFGEGSIRAKKKVAYIQKILDELGLGKDKLGVFEVDNSENLQQIGRNIKKRCLSIT